MNGWLWVGVAFLFLAWTISAYAYGRAVGFSLGMIVGSKTLATSRGAGQGSVQDFMREVYRPYPGLSEPDKDGHTSSGRASDDQC